MQEIVIKISEDIMEYVKNNGCLSVIYIDEVAKAIKDGTVLPKGHGDLIDYYDAIELINNKADEEDSNFTIGDIEKFGALLREVNPIIEADRSEECR